MRLIYSKMILNSGGGGGNNNNLFLYCIGIYITHKNYVKGK